MHALAVAAAASFLFADPMPLEMPRASSYLVRSNGESRVEDRYDALDLWTSQTVIGRWTDADGRVFTLARLDFSPPSGPFSETTRSHHESGNTRIGPRDETARDEAVSRLSPYLMPEKPQTARIGINGWTVLYYQRPDDPGLACAFLPKGRETWYFALWEFVEGDSQEAAREMFEDEFLAKWDDSVRDFLPTEKDAALEEKLRRRGGKPAPVLSERELLRRDVRHGVANYPRWHVTDGEDFAVADDLLETSGFVTSLTNELTNIRAKYASVMPTPVCATNILSVARVFRDRGEYAAALDTGGHAGMEWSAAYWSPVRREIVAFLPEAGETELLRTMRHEAFHRYISYACALASASPWLNEGYAQYFEDFDSSFRTSPLPAGADFAALAELLPTLLYMDYDEFYAGTQEERALKYALAKSIAIFIEEGAPKIARQPFKDLKRDYVTALLDTRDMRRATDAAFGSGGGIARFATEWRGFWAGR